MTVAATRRVRGVSSSSGKDLRFTDFFVLCRGVQPHAVITGGPMAALALAAACLGQAIDYSLRDAERLRKHLIYDTYIDSGAPDRESAALAAPLAHPLVWHP